MDGERDDAAEWGPRATDRIDWSVRAARASEAAPVEKPPPAAPPLAPRAPMPWLLVSTVALVCALVGGIAGGAIVAWTRDDSSTQASPVPASTPVRSATSGPVIAVGGDIAEVVARVRPAIVKIESTRHVRGILERDVGSGVLVDTAGHVVTNAHVVLGTETLKVVLADGSSRPAILVGHDSPFTDVAVLQIGPLAGVTPVPVGDSKSLRPGDPVIAVGNPLDKFEGSVTAGVVSGVNRVRLFGEVRQDDLIQTDAALNNGNSGGALLNLRGEFVGMPTAVLRDNPGAEPVEGIGFALPSERVMAIAGGIIAAGGAYPRPTLGFEHVDLVAGTTVRACRLAVDAGALVTAIDPSGPAASAGIQPCDVVTKVGAEVVDEDHPLLNALLSHKADETVTVVLNRSGRIIETDVRLGKRG